jgi:hypothetical protein
MNNQRAADRSGPRRGRTPAAALLALAIVTALAACNLEKDSVDFDRADRQSAGRRIELPADASISIGTSVEGTMSGVVKIPEGHPDAGVYTTDSPALVQSLVDVQHALAEPGGTASIKVGENGRILEVSSGVVKQ